MVIVTNYHMQDVYINQMTGLKQGNHIEEGILEAKTECYEKDKVKSPPFFDHFTTISSHFFDTYLYIFHKTEDQTVILRC